MTDESNFLGATLGEGVSPWNRGGLENISRLAVPDAILHQSRTLARADMTFQWSSWFAEMFGDPIRIAQSGKTYPIIFGEVLEKAARMFPNFDRDQRKEVASVITKYLSAESKILREGRSRQQLDHSERLLLLDRAGSPPRCWVCGYKFSELAISGFLGGKQVTLPLPAFIDVLVPRGLKERDLRIEVDHVVPYSRGGEEDENLRVSCGWCNRYKSSRTLLYDCEGIALRAKRNKLGITTLPHPFWVIRMLGTYGKCSDHDGCSAGSHNAQLTVVPFELEATVTPFNLRAVCDEHDAIADIRYQSRSTVEAIWSR